MKVCIDPGHGGNDPGAVGALAELPPESKLVLSISHHLRRKLDVRGVDVMMTRDTDVFIDLSGRAMFANGKNADLFLSVHCNSASNDAATGYEVFTSPGDTGADPFATDLFNVYGEAFPDMKARQDTSDGDPDKEAHFTVLKKTSMPAALFEVEFISNPQAHRWVNDNIETIATALANGVIRHIGEDTIPVPPPESNPPEQPLQKGCKCPYCGEALEIIKA